MKEIEELNQIQEILWKNGVRFFPWVGEDYHKGLSFDEDGIIKFQNVTLSPGIKILVLGESFYWGEEPFTPKNEEEALDAADFNNELISDYLKAESHKAYFNTFTKFSRALYGEKIEQKEIANLWNHLAFYNYIQNPLFGPRLMPKDSDFSNAESPFFKVLEELRPDYIIVWGKRLYEKLPPCDKYKKWEGSEGALFKMDDDDYEHESWVYKHGDVTVKMLGIYHPSSGFDWGYWHSVIIKFIKQYG